MLDKNDFTVNTTRNGYMIMYKGQPIGGAGIIGQSKASGRAAVKQVHVYNKMAQQTIENIINGNGPEHMKKVIERINNATK